MTADELWDQIAPALSKELGYGLLTSAEAQLAYDQAPEIPISEERVREIVEYVLLRSCMKYYTLRFPNDPPQNVVQMSREQFLEKYPRGPLRITDAATGRVVRVVPVPANRIECDYCDADPGDEVYVVGGTRGYCASCFRDRLARYCTEESR